MPGKTEAVGFARIFGHQQRDQLKTGQTSLRNIQKKGQRWSADISDTYASDTSTDQDVGFWRKMARKVAALLQREQHCDDLNFKLLSAYTSSFLHRKDTPFSARAITLTPSTAANPDLPVELSTPLGFRIAAAMDLAGACKMDKSRAGTIGMRDDNNQINDKIITRLDYLVNLTPQRLAYEFIAEKKHLPNGYLDHVLIPSYMDKLTLEGRLSERAAAKKLNALLKERELNGDRGISFETLMDIRNGVDQIVEQQQRKIHKAEVANQLPKGVPLQQSKRGSVHTVTVAQVFRQGMATRQTVREHLIQELRRQGESREEARNKVVAALENLELGHGSMVGFRTFKKLCTTLSLYTDQPPKQLIVAYLGLVSQLRSHSSTSIEDVSNHLKSLGLEPNETFEIKTSAEKQLLVIARPQLDPPSPTLTYNCNEDELWLIKQQVDRSFAVRFTKDMANRILRYAGRNKSAIGVGIAAKLSTAVVTAALTGGIGGVTYLAAAIVTLPLMLGLNVVIGKGKEWWYSRKVGQYDKQFTAHSNDPDAEVILAPAEQRKAFHENLGKLTAERTLTDSFNAFLNLQNELKGLDKLKGRANLSAAEQIKFRRHQVLQQLRSSQLGEKFEDLDRLMVETMVDLSVFEQRFDQSFDQLWAPFATDGPNGMSESRRLKIFNEAANRIMSKKDNKLVKENNREWLKRLGKDLSGSARLSDKHLAEAFGDIKALEAKELRVHVAASNFNKAMHVGKSVVVHSAKVVGHFVFTTLTWHAGKYAKAGVSWLFKGILPNQGDLVPVPTAAVCVYWVVSFIGGKTMGRLNDYLNKVRINKIMKNRTDDSGQEVAFDSDVSTLTTEDWRAMRREAIKEITNFAKLMEQLRTEHDQLDSMLRKLKPSAKDQLDDKRLIERAELILRRKYLEHQIGELMTNVVGVFHREMIRGEWLQRQLLEDKELGLS